MNNEKIYIAISNETGRVISGVKGQYAFGDKGSLNRSLAYSLEYKARKAGVKARSFYRIYALDVTQAITISGTEEL